MQQLMRRNVLKAYATFLKLVRHFSHGDEASELKFFGLGQFVLLLTLTPFIFSLSLYSFSEPKSIATYYEHNPDRFTQQDLHPPAPVKLRSNETRDLEHCPDYLASKKNKDKRVWERNKKDCKALEKKQAKYHAAVIANTHAEAFRAGHAPNLTCPPPSSCINVEKSTQASYANLLGLNASTDSWQQVNRLAWLLGLLLIFPTILLCIRRQRWGLLLLGLAVPAYHYILFLASAGLNFEPLSQWQINHWLIPKIAFCWFALRGQLRSKSFVYFIALLFLSTLLPNLLSAEDTFNTMKAQLPIVVFILIAAMLRLLVKGARENFYLLKNLGWAKGLKTAGHTVLLWLPLFIIASPFLYITEIALPVKAVDQLHDEGLLKFNHQHDLRDNALQTAALQADNTLYQWTIAIAEIKHDIKTNTAALREKGLEKSIMQQFDQIVPNQLNYAPYDSNAPIVAPLVELSVDAAQASTNKAFQGFINTMRGNLSGFLKGQEIAFQNALIGTEAEVIAFIEKRYEDGRDSILSTNRSTQTGLWWTMIYLRAMHQLSLLIFTFVCIKSLMYVFARVCFNRDTGIFVTLGDTQAKNLSLPESTVEPTGQTYEIQGDTDQTFFISRRYQCRGKAPNFKMPQPFYSPIARLFNRAYTMNKVSIQTGDPTVSCSATKGMEFFEWSLAEGETIIFDYHYFVGMSDSIKLSTLISPRMTSLLLGKMIYSQATGPGKLILVAKGRAEILGHETNTGSLPPERLIGMHKNTRLHIDSELDILNVYLSTAYIHPTGGGYALVYVDSQRCNKSGLCSFLKHFILPV